ncbi:MAG: L-histidine N(alpha)-methyltransferase [Gammaproteobacteria bacterium]|jgi:dimethylhistidine N-methyltransferase
MSLLAEKSANSPDFDDMLAEETAEILQGLQASPKRISPKYFYDDRGSALFDEICCLPEYYPTRTEQRIMQQNLPEIAALVGPKAAVIEFGAGSNMKARQLLRGLHQPSAYVPVEISGDYLAEQVAELAKEFPDVNMKAVVADFTKPFDLPRHKVEPRRNLVFFPGSTIGNFTRADASALLEVMRYEARSGGCLLIGVDLIKDVDVIRAAYNDQQGVTAAFNRNVLNHLNAGVGANFDPDKFRHDAIYDLEHNRIEMRLVSLCRQRVSIAGQTIEFADGEHIVTEYSHKYSIDGFTELAEKAGWHPQACWTDEQRLFSVHFLTAP